MIRQAVFEWKKIIRRRALSGPIIALFVFGLLIFAIRIFVPEFGSGFSPKSYRAAAEELELMDTEAAYALIEHAYEECLYEGKTPEKMYGKTVQEEIFLYEVLLDETAQTAGYESYVDGILESALRNGSGLFSGNTESQRVGEKIYKDFSDLEGIGLEFAGSFGIACAMQTDLWDILFFLILILFVYGLAITEYEERKVSLMRAAPKGRGICFGAKLLLGFFFVLILQSAVYLFRLILSCTAYGCPDLTIPFQTVYGAECCPLKVSVLGGIFLFFGWKLFTSVSLYILLLFLALLCSNAKLFYGVCIGAGAVSVLCYTRIDANSFLNKIKWLNPAAFLAADSILTDYRNISVMGFPFGYPELVAVICVCASLIFVFCSFRIYINRMPGGAGVLQRMKKWIKRPIHHHRSGLWALEHKKYWIYQAGALACLLYIVIAFWAYEPVREHLYTKEEIYYKYYVTQAEGIYTDEKLEDLYQEKQRLDDIEALLESGSQSNATVTAFYMAELEKRAGLEPAIGYVEYVKENGNYIIYEKGYELLIGKKQGRLALLLCRLASMALMCLISVTIWHYDKSTGMEKLIRISQVGNQRLNLYKYGNVILAGLLVFAMTYLPWIYNVYSVYGMQGEWAAAKSMEMFCDVSARISVLFLYAAYYLGHLLYLILFGCAGKWYTKRVGNYMGAVLSLFVTSMIPAILLYIFVS